MCLSRRQNIVSERARAGVSLIRLTCWTDNACIYPDLLHISRLGPNTAIYPITPPIFQMAVATHPDHIRLVIVCMTLSHRMNRARRGPECHELARNFFHHRGQLIRSLSEDIKVEHKCTSDLVIAGILTLLLVDVRRCTLVDARIVLTVSGHTRRNKVPRRIIGAISMKSEE